MVMFRSCVVLVALLQGVAAFTTPVPSGRSSVILSETSLHQSRNSHNHEEGFGVVDRRSAMAKTASSLAFVVGSSLLYNPDSSRKGHCIVKMEDYEKSI